MEDAQLKDFSGSKGAGDASIDAAMRGLGLALPEDYQAFLRRHDGGEGFVGKNYLILFHAEELVPSNREYEVQEYAPGLILFASDGGGEGYAFDARNDLMRIVKVPFIGMDVRSAVPIADSFNEFLSRLSGS